MVCLSLFLFTGIDCDACAPDSLGCARTNRGDVIGIAGGVIVRVAVVVRIGGVRSRNHYQGQTVFLFIIVYSLKQI